MDTAVESCSHKCNPSYLWGIFKSLKGQRAQTHPNQSVTFSSKSLTRNGEITKAFAKEFTSPIAHSGDQSAGIVKWKPLFPNPADMGTSYRPIFLLCLAAKVLERLLQPELNSLPLSPNQHGFCPNHSIVSVLLPLAHKIDLAKAFDMFNHTKIICAPTLFYQSNTPNVGYLPT